MIPGRTSGLSSLKRSWIPERGARMARRDDREYREYLRETQRSQPGCPARQAVVLQRGQATSARRLGFGRACGRQRPGQKASAPGRS